MKNTYLEQYKAQQLRACQLKQLSILEEIDRICQKHQIGYWLDIVSSALHLVNCGRDCSCRRLRTSRSRKNPS